jgi:hypothetical protein
MFGDDVLKTIARVVLWIWTINAENVAKFSEEKL